MGGELGLCGRIRGPMGVTWEVGATVRDGQETGSKARVCGGVIHMGRMGGMWHPPDMCVGEGSASFMRAHRV